MTFTTRLFCWVMPSKIRTRLTSTLLLLLLLLYSYTLVYIRGVKKKKKKKKLWWHNDMTVGDAIADIRHLRINNIQNIMFDDTTISFIQQHIKNNQLINLKVVWHHKVISTFRGISLLALKLFSKFFHYLKIKRKKKGNKVVRVFVAHRG